MSHGEKKPSCDRLLALTERLHRLIRGGAHTSPRTRSIWIAGTIEAILLGAAAPDVRVMGSATGLFRGRAAIKRCVEELKDQVTPDRVLTHYRTIATRKIVVAR